MDDRDREQAGARDAEVDETSPAVADEEAEEIGALDLPMPVLDIDDALDLLRNGDLEVVGRLYASSNNALLCLATRRDTGAGADAAAELVATCIYKPVAGERPLDDFPDRTLSRREVAAFVASQATPWNVVPPTVLRDGPFGVGMVQLWIQVDESVDPVGLVVDSDTRLRRIAVFDAALNNTDRKAGHLLPVTGGHVYGVDHGVTFSPVPKLRTVLWNWRGEPFAPDEIDVLRSLRSDLDGALGVTLRELLDPIEVNATARRIDRLLAAGVFPQPEPGRPALPWPPV